MDPIPKNVESPKFSPFQNPESVWGEPLGKVYKHLVSTVKEIAVPVFQYMAFPQVQQVDETLKELEFLANGDKRICLFVDQFVVILHHYLSKDSSENPSFFNTFFSSLDDPQSNYTYYSKYFIVSLLINFGNEILNKRKQGINQTEKVSIQPSASPENAARAKGCKATDAVSPSRGLRSRTTKQTEAPASSPGTQMAECLQEKFDDAEDLLSAVIEQILGKVFGSLDKVKESGDEEILEETIKMVDYFRDKCFKAQPGLFDQRLFQGLLWWYKNDFTNPLTEHLYEFFVFYAKQARLAKEIKDKPQFKQLEQSLDWLENKFQNWFERRYTNFKTSFKSYLPLSVDNPDLLAKILEKQFRKIQNEPNAPIKEVYIAIFGTLIDFKDTVNSVYQQSKNSTGEWLKLIKEEVKEANPLIDAAKGALDLYDQCLDDPQKKEIYKKNLVDVVLQARIIVLEKKYKSLKEKLKSENNFQTDPLNTIHYNEIIVYYNFLEEKIKKLQKQIKTAKEQRKQLEGEFSTSELMAMVKPVDKVDEIDWSHEFDLVCQNDFPENLDNLALSIAFGPGAKRIGALLVEQKFDSSPFVQECVDFLGNKLISRYLGNLAYDMRFHHSNLEKEAKESKKALEKMQEGKGKYLVQFLDQLKDSILNKPDEGDGQNPILLGTFSEVLGVEDLNQNRFMDSLLSEGMVILISKALKSAQGETFDEKIEFICKKAFSIFDTAFFKPYNEFIKYSPEKKKEAYEELIEKDIEMKFYTPLQEVQDEELHDQVFKYSLVYKMSRQLIEIIAPENQFKQVLPKVLSEDQIFETFVSAFTDWFYPRFEVLHETYGKLKSDVASEPGKKLEELLLKFIFQGINETAESYTEIDPEESITSSALFFELVAKGALIAAKDSENPNAIRDMLLGALNHISDNIENKIPHLIHDPALFKKGLVHITGLMADYFENGKVSEEDRQRFENKDRFIANLADKILLCFYPDGKDSLPLEKRLQEDAWKKIQEGLSSKIGGNLDSVENKTKLKALILQRLSKKDVDPNLSEDELNGMIEEVIVKQLLEKIAAKIPSFFKLKPFRIFFAPIIAIVTWLITLYAKNTTRKFLQALSREDFPIFIRKVIADFADKFLDSEKYKELSDDDKSLRKNTMRMAKKAGISYPVRLMASPQMTFDVFLNPNLDVLDFLENITDSSIEA